MFQIKVLLSVVGASLFLLFAGLVWADHDEGITSFDGGKMGSGRPGTTHTYRHTLSNRSGLAQSFTLVATSSKGFATSVQPSTLVLANGQSAPVEVRVTIPAGTPPGTLDITTLTASAGDAAPLTLTIRDSMLVSTDTPLKIPPLQTGQMVDGRRVYHLTMANSTTEFWPGVDTPTAGYNGSYLAPTLVMTASETVLLNVTNHLTESTTTHWHGFHLPAEMDGGPHQGIEPGTTWRPTWTVKNEASTLWFHPHPHPVAGHHGSAAGSTGEQVYRGLAGMALIRDAESNALALPQRYGVDEFPILLQDRLFHEDGSFDLSYNSRGQRKGDAFLINGTLAGHLDAPAQMVRLHLLNGSNFRLYNLGFSDNRPFQQIASDNALLNAPVRRTRIHLAPGERAEIVVDLSNAEGETLHLANYGAEWGETLPLNQSADEYDLSNFILFSMDVGPHTANRVTALPNRLNDIIRLPRSAAGTQRLLTLTTPSINGTTFDMDVVNITSTLDTVEVWSIVNLTNEPHPIHIHGSPFQVLLRDAPLPVEGQSLPDGGAQPPTYEMGWKDTIIVKAGERVDLIKGLYDYADPAAPFMYHCHLLEHEDAGMMGQYVVVGPVPPAFIYLPMVRPQPGREGSVNREGAAGPRQRVNGRAAGERPEPCCREGRRAAPPRPGR